MSAGLDWQDTTWETPWKHTYITNMTCTVHVVMVMCLFGSHSTGFLCELHSSLFLRRRCFALCEWPMAENWRTTAAEIMQLLCVKGATVGSVTHVSPPSARERDPPVCYPVCWSPLLHSCGDVERRAGAANCSVDRKVSERLTASSSFDICMSEMCRRPEGVIWLCLVSSVHATSAACFCLRFLAFLSLFEGFFEGVFLYCNRGLCGEKLLCAAPWGQLWL